MKLNFKGFFKAAGLFPLALMLSGCISYALVSHTAKGSSGKYQSQSDTITGLSQAKDSNGTKGYVFVGESLDYLITDGADDIVKMLNDPALNRHNIQVADDARFVLNAGKKKFTGTISLYYHWNNEEEKALATHYGFACGVQHCTRSLENLKGTIHEKNKTWITQR
ncbi:putative lipoprotein C [Escherichia coli DEC10D]|nr:putative lipoprotein C [Escherichia coli DEC10D]